MIETQQWRASIGLYTHRAHKSQREPPVPALVLRAVSLALKGVVLALLILSGDVESNPGPRTTTTKEHGTRARSGSSNCYYAVAVGAKVGIFIAKQHEFDTIVRPMVDRYPCNVNQRHTTEKEAIDYMRGKGVPDFHIFDKDHNVLKTMGDQLLRTMLLQLK